MASMDSTCLPKKIPLSFFVHKIVKKTGASLYDIVSYPKVGKIKFVRMTKSHLNQIGISLRVLFRRKGKDICGVQRFLKVTPILTTLELSQPSNLTQHFLFHWGFFF